MFKGCFVALVTPFKNGKVDKKALQEIVEWHITEGVDGFVPCGTTGESATLSDNEKLKVTKIVKEVVKNKLPVIPGTGSNSTKKTLQLTLKMKELKVDGVLVVAPYYNKPTQEGLYQHYGFIAKESKMPIIIYNIPGRTSVNILPETVLKLDKDFKEIVGIKESSGSLDQITQIAAGRTKKFCLLSGEDSLTLPLLSVGGDGVISAVANIIAKEFSQLCKMWQKKEIHKAQEIHYRIFPIIKAMFLETNPAPIKEALSIMGKSSNELRLPLVNVSSQTREKIISVLKASKII